MTAFVNEVCFENIQAGFRPEPRLTVSEWADQNRVLPQKAAAEPGRWRTKRTPYLKEIMNSLSSLSPIQEVVFMKGAQIGATEAGNNWIGYVIDNCPGPMLAVQPTDGLSKRHSRQRIAPLIEETPSLKEKVKDNKSRDSSNTILSKDFQGGVLVLTGANSAVGLRSIPARFLFLDEIDGYPLDVDGEGDPIKLATARSRTFSTNKKIYKVSTPTLEGRSKIARAYENSDQRKYYLPCPKCKTYQTLKWKQLKWPKGEVEKVRYICESCEFEIEEHHKEWMLEKGEWRKENLEFKNQKKIGFHLSSLYSPVGWYSWADAAREWEDIHKNKNQEELMVFVNTVLGETWKNKAEKPDWHRLYERRENYKLNLIPKDGLFLTAGVDVQKDRLELEIVAWGENKESWSIDYRVLPGDTSQSSVWNSLEQMVFERFEHETGVMLPISLMAVDSGYNTQMVYGFCQKFSMSDVIAIKGKEAATTPIGQPRAVEVTESGKTRKRGVKVWPLGVNLLKSELYAWLNIKKPVDETIKPTGFCHFPQYDDEYFKQLTAEELVRKIVRGYPKYVWEKIYERNEALDCRIYARAAASVFGMDRFKDEDWRFLKEELSSFHQVEPEVDKPLRRVESDYIDCEGFWD